MTTFHAIAGKQLPVFSFIQKISQVFRLKKQAQRFLYFIKETIASLTLQKYNKNTKCNKKIIDILLIIHNIKKIGGLYT